MNAKSFEPIVQQILSDPRIAFVTAMVNAAMTQIKEWIPNTPTEIGWTLTTSLTIILIASNIINGIAENKSLKAKEKVEILRAKKLEFELENHARAEAKRLAEIERRKNEGLELNRADDLQSAP